MKRMRSLLALLLVLALSLSAVAVLAEGLPGKGADVAAINELPKRELAFYPTKAEAGKLSFAFVCPAYFEAPYHVLVQVGKDAPVELTFDGKGTYAAEVTRGTAQPTAHDGLDFEFAVSGLPAGERVNFWVSMGLWMDPIKVAPYFINPASSVMVSTGVTAEGTLLPTIYFSRFQEESFYMQVADDKGELQRFNLERMNNAGVEFTYQAPEGTLRVHSLKPGRFFNFIVRAEIFPDGLTITIPTVPHKQTTSEVKAELRVALWGMFTKLAQDSTNGLQGYFADLQSLEAYNVDPIALIQDLYNGKLSKEYLDTIGYVDEQGNPVVGPIQMTGNEAYLWRSDDALYMYEGFLSSAFTKSELNKLNDTLNLGRDYGIAVMPLNLFILSAENALKIKK